MIFEILIEADKRGELLLVDGGMCHYRHRLDGQVTIHEIIVNERLRGSGIGSYMLRRLKSLSGATSIFAKCPVHLPANEWYEAMGFVLEGIDGKLNLWRLTLSTAAAEAPSTQK